jgi:hypothetical protein
VCRNNQSGLVINRLTSVLAAKRYAIVSKHKNSTCAIPSPEMNASLYILLFYTSSVANYKAI